MDGENGICSPDAAVQWHLLLYIISCILVFFVTISKNLYQIRATISSSTNLHASLVASMLLGTVTWRDSQPTGRKTNRFSHDIVEIDNNKTMEHLQNFSDCFLNSIQVIAIISLMVPILIPVVVSILLYDWFVMRKFLRLSRELKRLEAISHSPLDALFAESMSGISAIRAFRQEDRFVEMLCQKVDLANRYAWLLASEFQMSKPLSIVVDLPYRCDRCY